MSETHQWARYQLNERKYYNPKFGGNLKEFLRRMVEVEGFTITTLFPYYEGRTECYMSGKNGIQADNYDELAYQALNVEHANLDLVKDDNRQVISVMMSGDDYCDVIPINDWSFRRGQEDVVRKVIYSMRDEIMGDDA